MIRLRRRELPVGLPALAVATRRAGPEISIAHRTAGRPRSSGIATDTRAAALAAALEAITAHGHDRVRLRDVAGRCGLAVGSLQYLYGSRAQLLRAAYAAGAEVDLDLLERLIVARVPPRALAQSLLDPCGLGARTTVRRELWRAAQRDDDLAQFARDVQSDWEALLACVLAPTAREVAISVAGVRPAAGTVLEGFIVRPISHRARCNPP